MLDLLEGCACSVSPFELLFLYVISDGSHKGTKILNELPTEGGQLMKTMNLRKSLWFNSTL